MSGTYSAVQVEIYPNLSDNSVRMDMSERKNCEKSTSPLNSPSASEFSSLNIVWITDKNLSDTVIPASSLHDNEILAIDPQLFEK